MKVNDRSCSLSIAFKFFWHVEFELNQTGRHTRLSQLRTWPCDTDPERSFLCHSYLQQPHCARRDPGVYIDHRLLESRQPPQCRPITDPQSTSEYNMRSITKRNTGTRTLNSTKHAHSPHTNGTFTTYLHILVERSGAFSDINIPYGILSYRPDEKAKISELLVLHDLNK